MGTAIKAMVLVFLAVGLVGIAATASKDCSKVNCTSKEFLEWRDAMEAKEAAKAKALGMEWHSFQMKAGNSVNEFAGDVRQIAREDR